MHRWRPAALWHGSRTGIPFHCRSAVELRAGGRTRATDRVTGGANRSADCGLTVVRSRRGSPVRPALEQLRRGYILREVLAGEDPSQLHLDTPLVTSGLLDSNATLRFVSLFEQECKISISAHEARPENFDSIEKIAGMVMRKERS